MPERNIETSLFVRLAPKADKHADITLSPLRAISGCEQSQQSSRDAAGEHDRYRRGQRLGKLLERL